MPAAMASRIMKIDYRYTAETARRQNGPWGPPGVEMTAPIGPPVKTQRAGAIASPRTVARSYGTLSAR